MQASLPSVKYRTGWKDCYNSNYYRLVNESRDIFKNVDSLDKTQLRHIGFWLEEGLAWAINLLLWITPANYVIGQLVNHNLGRQPTNAKYWPHQLRVQPSVLPLQGWPVGFQKSRKHHLVSVVFSFWIMMY